MPSSRCRASSKPSDFNEVLAKLANSPLQVQEENTRSEEYLAFSYRFKNKVRNLKHLKTFIDDILDNHGAYPNTLIFNQMLQLLAKLTMTHFLCSMLEIAESRELVDVESYKIVLGYLSSFPTPRKLLMDRIFARALRDSTLFDSYTFKFQFDSLGKYEESSAHIILDFLHVSIEKNLFTSHLCYACLNALHLKQYVSISQLLSVFVLALGQYCADLEMFEMIKRIYIDKNLGRAESFTGEWTKMIGRFPANIYQSDVFMMLFENAEYINVETLIKFDKLASKHYANEALEIYIDRFINLFYRFKHDVIPKYASDFGARLLDMPLDLGQHNQTFSLVGLSESQTYYSMKRFLNKHKFLNTLVPFEINFEISENQQDAFFSACQTVPQLADKLQKQSATSYRIILEPKQFLFALSQYSAFKPYQLRAEAKAATTYNHR